MVLIPFFTETEDESNNEASAANTTETSISEEETSFSTVESSSVATETETSESEEETTTSSKEKSSEKQTASSTEESEEESNSEAKENQEAASEEFEGLTSDGSYPYASDVNVETEDDGDIDYVELVVTGDWANFNDKEKENYIGLLKTVAAEFMDEDGKLPFMQVKMANDIVARSEVLDSQSVKVVD
ncbi:hypothetical protein KV134_08935 [Tetragenococcus halophilus]|nr:hypothetical protein KV134_08935 [Tetragenococcus halophilus]